MNIQEKLEAYQQLYEPRFREYIARSNTKECVTERGLLLPFLNKILGLDTTDCNIVSPQSAAGFSQGAKNNTTSAVDYAIKTADDIPEYLIEAKKLNAVIERSMTFHQQIAGYFASKPSVKLLILTNGSLYRIYTDSIHENLIDEQPIYNFNIFSLTEDDYHVIEALTTINSQLVKELLLDLRKKYKTCELMRTAVLRMFSDPSDEFLRDLYREIDPKVDTTNSRFGSAQKAELKQYVMAETQALQQQVQRALEPFVVEAPVSGVPERFSSASMQMSKPLAPSQTPAEAAVSRSYSRSQTFEAATAMSMLEKTTSGFLLKANSVGFNRWTPSVAKERKVVLLRQQLRDDGRLSLTPAGQLVAMTDIPFDSISLLGKVIFGSYFASQEWTDADGNSLQLERASKQPASVACQTSQVSVIRALPKSLPPIELSEVVFRFSDTIQQVAVDFSGSPVVGSKKFVIFKGSIGRMTPTTGCLEPNVYSLRDQLFKAGVFEMLGTDRFTVKQDQLFNSRTNACLVLGASVSSTSPGWSSSVPASLSAA